jgi:preprotein translocase SecE subunit
MPMLEQIKTSRAFIEESWAELQKVTWPDYEQLRSATIVIIVFVILISATIWIMDFVVRTSLNGIMGIFGA